MSEKKKDVLQPVDDQARRLAQTLLRTARFASLGTLDRDGNPFVSRIGLATQIDGRPIWLISQLSSHFVHLAADPRCSLLVGEPGKGDPLAHPRLTVVGRARRIVGEAPKAMARRYLARHPKAALYVDFPDFAFWTADVSRGSLNAGFGKAYALEPQHVLPADFKAAAFDVDAAWVADLNKANAGRIDTLAASVGGDGSGWEIATFDADGADLVKGDRCTRVWFSGRLATADELAEMLARDAAAAPRSAT